MLNAACSTVVAQPAQFVNTVDRPTCTVMWPGMWSLMRGGHSLKYVTVCAATLTHFQTACHRMTPFIFHILHSPNDPHFQNALSLNELTPFFRNIHRWKWPSCSHWMTPISGGGGTRIWKWRTSAYRRTKIGGVRCKISSKKGGHSVWAPKKWGLFGLDSKTIGVIQCVKMQFQGKICKFSVKIATKLLSFSKCARSTQQFALFMYILIQKWKRRGHWVWTE